MVVMATILVSLVAGTNAAAPTPSQETGTVRAAGLEAAEPAGREADRKAIQRLLRRVESAVNQQDTLAISECFSKDFFLTTTDQKLINGINELEAYYEKVFTGPNARVKSVRATLNPGMITRFINESTGVCYGTASEHYVLRGGKSGDITSRWTAVCVKENGVWRVAVAHAGVDFLSNSVLTHIKRSSMMLVTIASLVSLLLGAVISHLVFRKTARAPDE
jgi:uncharacterized protein (TIGR02246 family)